MYRHVVMVISLYEQHDSSLLSKAVASMFWSPERCSTARELVTGQVCVGGGEGWRGGWWGGVMKQDREG